MTEWTQEQLAYQPDEFTPISEKSIMQRKNIQKVEHDENDGQPAYTEYICESRKLTNAEYQKILDERMNDAEDIIASLIGEAK
ncbi:MAG: hypothetical protein ACOX6E_09220 [Syntrophomonadaceae bacterium]|jgi:hypothetical protein